MSCKIDEALEIVDKAIKATRNKDKKAISYAHGYHVWFTSTSDF